MQLGARRGCLDRAKGTLMMYEQATARGASGQLQPEQTALPSEAAGSNFALGGLRLSECQRDSQEIDAA
jgi:hypothetical protein